MGRDLSAMLRPLRDEALTRLVEIRGSIDPDYDRLDPADARDRFDVLLAHIEAWLATGDRDSYEDALGSWAAMRFGEGGTADGVIHAVVAVADVLARIGQRVLPGGDDASAFACAVIDASFVATRVISGALADELEARRAQLRRLGQ